MSTKISIPAQILGFFEINRGGFTTAHIAGAIGVPTKSVSSAVTRLIRAGELFRLEDGRIILASEANSADETTAEEPVSEPETAEETEQAEPTAEPTPEPETARKPVDIEATKVLIAKLLNKAERTDNEHERDAFNAQAERMMLRLGIEKAELEAVGEVKPEEIVEVTREWHGNYSIVMVPFVNDVALGFGNLTVLQSTRSAMLRKTYIIGHKSDVEAFLVLIDSLALQVMSGLRRWQKENIESRRGLTDMEKYVQHRSFIAGFGQTVRTRLMKMRKVEEKTASTGAALVLASKMDRIGAHLAEQYPNLGKARGGMQYHSSIGMQAGRTAGESANLGGKAVKGSNTALEA
jgi:hypothetical protein